MTLLFVTSLFYLCLNVKAPCTRPWSSSYLVLHTLHSLCCPHTLLQLSSICLRLPKSMSPAQTASCLECKKMWLSYLHLHVDIPQGIQTEHAPKCSYHRRHWDKQICSILSESHGDNASKILVSSGPTYTLLLPSGCAPQESIVFTPTPD